MANNNSLDEYLVYLKENARELRKLGKEWGMSEEEIDSCVDEALSLSEDSEDLKNSPKNIARKIWGYFLIIIKLHVILGLVLIGLFVGLYIAGTYHQPTQRFIVQAISDYSYEIMRFVRLIAIPLHSMFPIAKYHHEECLVKNPFYVQEAADCKICTSFKKIKALNASAMTESMFSSYTVTMKPVQIKNTMKWNVTYADIRRLYNSLQDNLFYRPHQFTSNSSRIQSLEDLFTEDLTEYIESMENLHLHWKSQTVKASAGLRSLFPRPSFLPGEAEVTLGKNILIDGPNSTTYRLEQVTSTPLNLYILGSGHRRVLVRAAAQCRDVCSSMLVHMEQGDSLLFNRDLWELYIAAGGNETTVGYVIGIQT